VLKANQRIGLEVKMKSSRRKFVLSQFLAVMLMTTFLNNPSPASAGIFDCIKVKKWSNYTKLRVSYFKDPALKTQGDWTRSYIFARLFTGYPKCFNKKDVNVMNQFVNLLNSTCLQNSQFGDVCRIAQGNGPMSDWVYNGYK
jgi:hypothetical protein